MTLERLLEKAEERAEDLYDQVRDLDVELVRARDELSMSRDLHAESIRVLKGLVEETAQLRFDLKNASEAMCSYAKDASRYRWLKANARRIDFAGLCWTQGCELDARVDIERTKGQP